MRITLDALVQAVGGAVSGAGDSHAILTSVTTDSRTVSKDAVFVCLTGTAFDGHQFAAQAVAAGASAILGERNPFADMADAPSVPVILVPNALEALGRLAHAWRAQCTSTQVVGITGTAGKTTVKELLAQVLAQKGTTARNPLNLNNQIGLPLSMLNTQGTEAFWVMEAGISQPHDMDELGTILEPDIALVLNAGTGHTAGLGDRGTAHYKARLFTHLASEGRALVSADYPDLVREARAVKQDLIFFSAAGKQVPYRAAYVTPAGETHGLYRLWLDGEAIDVEAPFRGSFGAENVIAVAAVAHCLGLSPAEIASGLAQATLPKQRFACSHVGDWLVIDDSYNANPLSFARMLEAASEMTRSSTGKALVCVLGEMGELGDVADMEHERLGVLVAQSGAHMVLWKGGQAQAVERGLRQEGFKGVFMPIATPESMEQAFEASGLRGGVLLVKGSRSNKLEVLVNAFITSRRGEVHAL